MILTEHALRASGLPACWAAQYEALRPAPARERAVRHTTGSINRMPAGYRWAIAGALRLLPAAFYALTRQSVHRAAPEVVRGAAGRLRSLPGCGELLRATTALALYGALDGTAPRVAHVKESSG
ncbi:hypothetical protein [Streptomyces enissocaesilis]|uniref:Uncharacterized protein n=1 Tax=Streptomyces enissocaesilis TaxID=332589 RepID=A0ABN3XLJ3_9ACTN